MRIAGITIPEEKRLEIGLTALYGVGRPRAKQTLKALGIDWGIEEPILSARDKDGRTLAELAGMLPRFEPA